MKTYKQRKAELIKNASDGLVQKVCVKDLHRIIDGSSALHVIAQQGNLHHLPNTVFTKESLTVEDLSGSTVLAYAAVNGQLGEIPSCLITEGMMLRKSSIDGSTPQFWKGVKSHSDAVKNKAEADTLKDIKDEEEKERIDGEIMSKAIIKTLGLFPDWVKASSDEFLITVDGTKFVLEVDVGSLPCISIYKVVRSDKEGPTELKYLFRCIYAHLGFKVSSRMTDSEDKKYEKVTEIVYKFCRVVMEDLHGSEVNTFDGWPESFQGSTW